MQAHNHETSTFAFVCVCATAVGAPVHSALTLALVATVAADWPDIDAEQSRVIKALWFVPWFPVLMKRFSAMVFDLCATDEDRRNTTGWGTIAFRVHRGFWHSIWGALLTGGIYAVLGRMLARTWPDQAAVIERFFAMGVSGEILIGATICLAMVGHILGDSCTDFGTSPYAPVLMVDGHRYPVVGLWEPMRFKVGKDVERVLITPLCMGLAWWGAVGTLQGHDSPTALLGLAGGVFWSLLGKRRQQRLLRSLGLAKKRKRRRRRRARR